jgi:hypothetical protein
MEICHDPGPATVSPVCRRNRRRNCRLDCDNFLYGFKGTPCGRASRPACGRKSRTGREATRGTRRGSGVNRDVLARELGRRAHSGGGWLPLPAGGIPAVAARRPARLPRSPQAPGSRSNAAQRPCLRELAGPSSTRRASSRRAKITVKGATACGLRVADAMAQAPPLTLILPGKTAAAIGRTDRSRLGQPWQ